MRMQVCLFGKTGKQLTKYQQKMNEVAGDICVKDPQLLMNKGRLIEVAREKLHESGYVYKKGKSRSKAINPPSDNEPKCREKIDKIEREHRMSSLTEQIKDIQKHIQVKEKRIKQANGIQNFKLCDQLSEEVVSLKEKRREAEATLRILKSKQKKSDQYFARKIRNEEVGLEMSTEIEAANTNTETVFL